MATVKLRVYLLPGNIQHSQVEVFGKELSYSVRGIEYFNVGVHDYGNPSNIYTIGVTNKSLESFFLWLDERVDSIFHRRRYHILGRNCHDFSNAVCLFLCGVGIPNIIRLPQIFAQIVTGLYGLVFGSLVSGGSRSSGQPGRGTLYKKGNRW